METITVATVWGLGRPEHQSVSLYEQAPIKETPHKVHQELLPPLMIAVADDLAHGVFRYCQAHVHEQPHCVVGRCRRNEQRLLTQASPPPTPPGGA